ncbi:MAG: phage tail protein [Rhodospirillales bacterium]|jgi:hypothetical protein|nr:phage tail protein [Rhodospirillales bacterium]
MQQTNLKHPEQSGAETDGTVLIARYRRAVERRSQWESLWRDCYSYALPQRDGVSQSATPGTIKTVNLFDGTAPDAVDQLAASLLGELTPPWGQWFALRAGSEASSEVAAQAANALEQATSTIRNNFERSNFAIEMHQCFLDLATAGTACLLFEEAEPGSPSAFKFTAIPLGQIAFEENSDGLLNTTYRRSELDQATFAKRFPKAVEEIIKLNNASVGDEVKKIVVIEAVSPDETGFMYSAVLEASGQSSSSGKILVSGSFSQSPFINFRWLKTPGETYGRSPVMKALPDIKTANKVVELILKNASIAVTGIWQADDDGVLNPATVQLTPGSIIPKAVGSAGLTPLKAPGSFDVSQLVLDDLRTRIRKSLLADSLAQINSPKMTATEVLQRSAEMTRLLGATYGRLQSELLGPLMNRAIDILSRRGDIPAFDLDGRSIALDWRSPLARAYTRQEASDALHWAEAVRAFGPEAAMQIDTTAMVQWLAKAFDVPGDLVKPPTQQVPNAAPEKIEQQLEEVLPQFVNDLLNNEVSQ